MHDEPLVFRVHALKRMAQRGIDETQVRHVLETGETIEAYPEDKPHPSQLVLGWAGERPIHVVAAQREPDAASVIITVYEPDTQKWEPGFKRRRVR